MKDPEPDRKGNEHPPVRISADQTGVADALNELGLDATGDVKPRFCVDCVHMHRKHNSCNRPILSLVTGKFEPLVGDLTEERKGACGPEGRYWKELK